MNSSLIRRWTSFAVSFLMMGSLISPAMASEISQEISKGLESIERENSQSYSRRKNLNDFEIVYKQNDLNMRYGEYAELEFSANINEEVEFVLDDAMYPVGLQFQSIGSNVALLGGNPEFLDEYCFTVYAKSKNSDKESSERVCVFAEANDRVEHAGFVTDRQLQPLQKDSYGQATIELDHNGSHIQPMFVLGALPEGLNLDNNNGEMYIKGDAEYAGVFEFVVLAEDERRNIFVYKQFILEVMEDNQQGYQCPVGYYYDTTVGYCVQNAGDICGQGTFYDPERNECVAYPSNTQCGPGQYYDHFLFRCVNNSYNRCPYNYEWDPYYNRCQRLPYTCSIGYRYSHLSNSCVYVGTRMCGIGEHYSAYRGRCVSNFRFCRAGEYWNGHSCRRTVRSCSYGNYWDPVYRSCRSSSVYRSCRPGSYYSYNSHRCVRRTVFAGRNCPVGHRYSTTSRSCVRYRVIRTNNRPRPRPRRPIRVRPTRPHHGPTRPTTRPRPTRPSRPTTRPTPSRPSRPTTRPTPSRPSRPTTRPTPSRPSRPTTRPTPSRPSRPTTRPTPSRPSRPTTRPTPSRPSRPTTRPTPSRPSRPTTRPTPSRPSRPTTRPSRPSRGSGSARPSRSSGSSSRSNSSSSRRGRGGRGRG